ncbi:hypothetical protein FHS15_002910 [Paenibacillus castaneae]|uniref:hypothetical protein n=1 Tax=Paenibacillus castaneae TaxID=474957 RepID=UPI000C99A229|nr:hypothetical protein [Paenibacillus castaneae]NIK77772.1 hypothetical protein [Paenibacillus castaneae]
MRNSIAVGCLVMISIIAVIIIFNLNRSEIKVTVIENENEINQKITRWMAALNQNKGVHVFYEQHDESRYEYWLFFNKNDGKNLYNTFKIRVEKAKETLKIFITDVQANNDNEVKNTITAKFEINRKPNDIEVYYNGDKQNVDIKHN